MISVNLWRRHKSAKLLRFRRVINSLMQCSQGLKRSLPCTDLNNLLGEKARGPFQATGVHRKPKDQGTLVGETSSSKRSRKDKASPFKSPATDALEKALALEIPTSIINEEINRLLSALDASATLHQKAFFNPFDPHQITAGDLSKNVFDLSYELGCLNTHLE